MRRSSAPYVLLAAVLVALLATVWLPFVNRPALWFGLPSVMVWSTLGVIALTPVLAWIEFEGTRPDAADRDPGSER